MKLFHFDCFAVLVDDWSREIAEIPANRTTTGKALPAEPSVPEGEPELLGLFLSSEDALNYIAQHKADIHAAELAEHNGSIWRGLHSFEPRYRTYFLVSIASLAWPKRDPLSELEELLKKAALAQTTGIGAGWWISDKDREGYILRGKLDAVLRLGAPSKFDFDIDE